MKKRSEEFNVSELKLVTDPTPVEHFGGPDDGAWLPLCTNGCRPGGMYVPINSDETGEWVCIGMQWVAG